jgi:adenosylhomocysteine nucleosidase
MKIGIITAMPEETRAIVGALARTQKTRLGSLVARQARVAGKEIVVAEAGMGFANATTVARQLMGELRVDLMISAGFCGGIRAGLRVGDVVLAASLAIVSEDGLEEVPYVLPAVGREFVSRQAAAGQRVFAGLFASTKAIMRKRRLAALLPVAAPFPVVEMESAAIALVAGEHGVPFVGLRTVSDAFDEEIGFSLDELCDDQMRIRLPKVLRTIVRKPGIVPQLVRLAWNGRAASASLTRSVARFLAAV